MKLDHIAIAVRSLEEALPFYTDVLGLPCTGRETIPEQGVHLAMLPLDEGRLELLEPLSEESPVGRFLARRGEGLHHICFQVEDIQQTLVRLRTRGLRLIDEEPRCGAEGRRIAFLHPASAHGVLIEFVEVPKKEAET